MMGSIMNTWEERTFMEDARGQLGGGGCMWPQRSYSCSFCRREFRSAQALGGHMNVHRRDRARLKQSLDLTSCGSHSSSRVSALSTQESSPNDRHARTASPLVSSSSSSTFRAQQNHKGCLNSSPERQELVMLMGLNPSSCKRFKASNSVSTLSLLGNNHSASSVDDIDLELRLGVPPTVK